MEAKETVMGNLAEAIMNHPDLPMGPAIAMEQAEISFKAGQQNGLSLEMQGEAYCQGVLVGIREVVEATIYLAIAKGHVSIRELFELHPEGKAKLKKWGLDK